MGGMENPLLTFASPTIITSDKSQVDVATHEIAHSWTGNDVTCQNWTNMWLNEGFTVFEERKVTAKIHDDPDVRLVAAYLGNISMVQDMMGYGLDSNYSSLHPELGDDVLTSGFPDDSFSEVPYEKGFQFLFYLETLLGEDAMQELIQTHILNSAQSSIDYHVFKEQFETFVNATGWANATSIIGQVDWETWVRAPGLPPIQLDFTTKELNASKSLAEQYVALNGTSPSGFDDYNSYDSNLKQVFGDTLLAMNDSINLVIMNKIDEDLNITNTVDPEVKKRWFPLGIMQHYDNVTEPAHEFISSMGRMKYLTPIYQALMDSGEQSTAQAWYAENVGFYHPYAVQQVAKIVNAPSKPKPSKAKQSGVGP